MESIFVRWFEATGVFVISYPIMNHVSSICYDLFTFTLIMVSSGLSLLQIPPTRTNSPHEKASWPVLIGNLQLTSRFLHGTTSESFVGDVPAPYRDNDRYAVVSECRFSWHHLLFGNEIFNSPSSSGPSSASRTPSLGSSWCQVHL
jgi:hypothetical protein